MVPSVITAALNRLDAYVRDKNWTGYDPYDIKAHRLYLSLSDSKITGIPIKATFLFFPLFFRRLLSIKAVPHAKAMALFAESYLTLYDLTGKEEHRKLAEGRLTWLLENTAPGFSGYAWGLPFAYKGRDFVPGGSPSVVITAIAAQAFLHAARSTGNPLFLEAAKSACAFLATDIPRYEPDSDRLCFSKSPEVQWHIHNANMMIASTLSMVGRATGTNEWDDPARRAVNYTLAEQRKDGAWYYWGPPDRLMHWVDHYHTGFVLRALYDLYTTTGWSDLSEPLDRGYAFYTQMLFSKRGIPRFTDGRRYPIDIHCCAEAIICMSRLASRYNDALSRAGAVARWTISNMQDNAGFFYYRRYPWYTIKIPFMRWGQAWMMLALAGLQKAVAMHST